MHNKELLSIVWAFEVWWPYLEGNSFPVEVMSDHCNLKYFMMAHDLNRHQTCWSLFLNWFVFTISHKPGRLSAGPDGLSCRPDHEVLYKCHDNASRTVLPVEQVAKRAVVLLMEQFGPSETVGRVATTQVIVADSTILEQI